MELIRIKLFIGDVVDAYRINKNNAIYYEDKYKITWLVGIDENNEQTSSAIVINEGVKLEQIPGDIEDILSKMKEMTLLDYVLCKFDRSIDISIDVD
ncbi:MAG: hypothetical protein ACQET8_22575 [Bacillota bacterium]